MKIRRFFGKDMREALKQVKDELGGNAVIMSNKKVANGVELVAAIDPAESDKLPTDANLTNSTTKKTSANLREVIGDSGSDSLQALLEKQLKARANKEIDDSYLNENNRQAQRTTQNTQTKSNTNSSENDAFINNEEFTHYSQKPDLIKNMTPRADDRIFRSPAFSETQVDHESINNKGQASGIQPPPSVLEPDQLNSIKAELESIKNVLKFQVNGLAEEKNRRKNPVHQYLLEELKKMGISKKLAQQFVEFLPNQIDQKQGWRYVLRLLSNRIHVGANDILTQSGVVALVGPTGTGKTTTIAKLAAKYAQKYGSEQVAMITIDTYRIAAFEQLATYGKIIGCVVKKAYNSQELNDALYQLRNKKLVLIDTAGFSQRDERLIEQLKQYEVNVNMNIKKYLILPAGAQYQVLNQTVKAYRGTQLNGCIFSKLDESYSLGEALSVMIENDLSLSYVTDGQRVPEDIKLADAANLTLIAAKLYKRYGHLAANTDADTVGVL